MTKSVDDNPDLFDPPGPPGCPFLGSLPALSVTILDFLEHVRRRFGHTVLYRLAGKRVYLITRPEDLARFFREERNGAYQKKFFHRAFYPAFGNGVFNSYGADWKQQREILQGFFRKKDVERWFPVISEETTKWLGRWSHELPHTLQAEKALLPLVQSIMCRILFGRHLGDADSLQAVNTINIVSQQTLRRALLATVGNGFLNRLPTPGNRRYQQALQSFDELISRLHQQHTVSSEDDSLLARMAGHFDLRTLRDQCFTLFFAGQDTTVNTLAFTLYYLGRYPPIQDRCRKETEALLEGRNALNYAGLQQLRYTNCVIAESMRLSPAAFAGSRDVVGDQQINGYRIRDNSLLVFSPYLTQRDPDIWENPEVFDPDRFYQPNGQRETHAWFPYGGGMRTCLGIHLARTEILTIIALLLYNFEFRLTDSKPPKLTTFMTLRARQGINLEISRIKR